MEEWKDGRVEEWKDGRMEGWKDGRIPNSEPRNGVSACRRIGVKWSTVNGNGDGRVEGWKGENLRYSNAPNRSARRTGEDARLTIDGECESQDAVPESRGISLQQTRIDFPSCSLCLCGESPLRDLWPRAPGFNPVGSALLLERVIFGAS
jgi:hypothetical protein